MRKVLIVEDNNWVAETHHRTLTRAGFLCSHAATAAQALQLVDDFLPDVILLDMLLPKINALQLLHELQSYGDTSAIPVVLCTGLSDIRHEAVALEAYGVKIVLDKATMTPGQLVAAVTDVQV